MAVGVQKAWSVTAASNASADSNVSFAEGQTPASLNDGIRAQMAAIKGWANQVSAAKTTGGSANAQTLTSDSVAAISTAYAAGMIFCVKAGFTNTTTTPTFNVDGVGAKTIKKGGAQAALAAGDITAGGIYWLAYEASGDCFLVLNPDGGSITLDATLTALGALSWSSGSPLVQFTAADTVSLTLTPSVTSVGVGNGAAATPSLYPASDTNTGVRFDGADNMYLVTGGTDRLLIGTNIAAQNGATFRAPNGSVSLPALTFVNDTDNGWYLINTSNNWAGAVGGSKFMDISSTLVDFSVPVSAQYDIKLSAETSGTLTSASRDKYIDCAGGVTFPNSVFAAGQWQYLIAGSASRTLTRGTGIAMYVNGSDVASATLAARGTALAFWDGASTLYVSGDVS